MNTKKISSIALTAALIALIFATSMVSANEIDKVTCPNLTFLKPIENLEICDVDIITNSCPWALGSGNPSNLAASSLYEVDASGRSVSNEPQQDPPIATNENFPVVNWTIESATGNSAYWMGYASSDSNIYYVDGLGATGNMVHLTQEYDPATNTWNTSLAQTLTPVYGAVAGWMDGKLYVAGGFTIGFSGTNKTQIYDPSTDSWSYGSDMPCARGGAMGGVVNGKLYVTGGSPTDLFSDVSNSTYEYDPATDIWITKSDCPEALLFGAGAVSNEELYVGGDYRGYNNFYNYAPAADMWTTKAVIPHDAGKMSPVMVEAGGYIYLYGGNPDGGWGTYLTTTYQYDPVLDTWKPHPAVLNTGVMGHGGGSTSGKIWSFGGTRGHYALHPAPHESLNVKPVIEVEKTIWDAVNGIWAKEITANVGNVVRFNCTIHNNGTCYNLTNITVYDLLPESLEYANNATHSPLPPGSYISPDDRIVWEFSDTLEPCDSITIEFDAYMIKAETGVNIQNATAWCEKAEIWVSDEDTATVVCVSSVPPASDPAPVPALTPIGIAVLVGLLGIIGACLIMRRR
jgi:uncharacterized repeat protein (TIGR01451 family)